MRNLNPSSWAPAGIQVIQAWVRLSWLTRNRRLTVLLISMYDSSCDIYVDTYIAIGRISMKIFECPKTVWRKQTELRTYETYAKAALSSDQHESYSFWACRAQGAGGGGNHTLVELRTLTGHSHFSQWPPFTWVPYHSIEYRVNVKHYLLRSNVDMSINTCGKCVWNLDAAGKYTTLFVYYQIEADIERSVALRSSSGRAP